MTLFAWIVDGLIVVPCVIYTGTVWHASWKADRAAAAAFIESEKTRKKHLKLLVVRNDD